MGERLRLLWLMARGRDGPLLLLLLLLLRHLSRHADPRVELLLHHHLMLLTSNERLHRRVRIERHADTGMSRVHR